MSFMQSSRLCKLKSYILKVWAQQMTINIYYAQTNLINMHKHASKPDEVSNRWTHDKYEAQQDLRKWLGSIHIKLPVKLHRVVYPTVTRA